MNAFKLILSLISILGFVNTVLADKQFSVISTQCTGDTDYFTVDSVSCDSYCTWGSKGNISGSYTILTAPSTDTPVITASLLKVKFFDDTVDICHGATDTYGNACPDAGTYAFETQLRLPGSPSSWYSNVSWPSITVPVTLDFGDANVTCKIRVKGTSKSSSYSSMILGSAVVVLGAVAFKRRKRHIAITKEELEGTDSSFLAMAEKKMIGGTVC